ncbi:nuclear transport factor 2 family protein [Brevundimonas lenta]|uniref:Putative SnoaL-like aldol condensation-catalyzing enzyme n=1 Tax=Brevundimonas lenta TaxID=424796 RepID=A0A7W6JE74_9CAUL|nr:nuclear transport factor 2 family protein [Brevundimonas lenta]MBB4083466.1 putative SnoaL-like aldol condensation-catalyzing enzyme [Brevundimonas lenta]
MRNPGLFLIACITALAAGPALAGEAADCDGSPAANRELVVAFYTLGLVERQPQPAFERYVAPDFVEHKPDIPGGTREAAVDFLGGIIRDVPTARWEILRSAAQDDLVFVHARMTPAPGAGVYALADIFRVEDCRIVEHWDVVGGPTDMAVNPHPRF